MPNFDADLSRVALILWSGMLIIAGSIWILTAQVRRLGEVLEGRPRSPAAGAGATAPAPPGATITTARATTRHSAPLRTVRVARTVAGP
jgi:hypothetical protein